MRAILLHLSLMFAALQMAAQSSNVRWEYINRYKEIAVNEMKRTGIPASIKLAQGILESNGGASTLARKANNHFGMKCGSEWRGPTYYIKDDDYDENGQLIESCFRAYEDAEASYIAHSEFLRDPNKAYRYGFLFRLDQKDYKKWAQGLKQSGYATSPTYSDALISLIDQYKLYNFDQGNLSFDEIRLINDVRMTLAKMGQTPEELARKYNVKTRCLLKYNEGLAGPNQPLKEGEYIYLQRKRWFFRGKQQYHFVKEGETMYTISQQYGLKQNRLFRKNRMDKGTEPAVGQKIRLRGRVGRGQTPKLREVQSSENGENSIPLDEGSGKILDMDPTNVVKPGDLPNSNGNTPSPNNGTTNNPSNNGGTNSSNANNGGTTTNNNNTGGTKPNTTNNNSTTNNGSPTKPSTTTGGDSGTKPNSTTPNNSGTSNTNSTGTKPSTTTGNNGGIKPSTTNGNTTTTNNNNTTKPSGSTVKPKPEPAGGINPTPATPTNSAGTTVHTVKTGETLYAISKMYSVSVDQIKTLNGLKDNNIKLGQVLTIKK
jgi:LysM repeat protein